MRPPPILAAFGAFGVTTGALSDVDPPFFLGLGDLPGKVIRSAAYAVSANGRVVVGEGRNADGDDEAFRWVAETGMLGLGTLPTFDGSSAYAVSADGLVIAGVCRHFGGWGRHPGFRWTAAAGFDDLGDLDGGGTDAPAYAASADGSVVAGEGQSLVGNEAYYWTAQTGVVGLGQLPGEVAGSGARGISADGRVIVGWGRRSVEVHEPFRWTREMGMVGLGDLPGGAGHGMAEGVSADGLVVIGTAELNQYEVAFRWTEESGMEALQEGYFAHARAASWDGSVIVGWATDGSDHFAFYWTEATGAVPLQELLTDYGLDLAGWDLWNAYGVSADGRTIVGMGYSPLGQEAFIAFLGKCWGDCDQNGALNLFDYLCFQNQFEAGNFAADCDLSGVLDLFDFLCFVNEFNKGC